MTPIQIVQAARHVVPRMRAAAMLGALLSAFLVVGVMAEAGRSQEVTPEQAAPAEPRRFVIRFLTEGEFPPFNYYDDEGVLSGFNVDLARAICLEVGAACDIKVRPWEELLIALRRGDADAVIAAHTVTAGTLAEVDFSDRYFYTPGRFASRTGETVGEITPEGLDGVTVGVAKGTAHEAFIKAFFRDSRIVLFENPELAREALQQSKVDLIFDDAISLAFWINGSLSRQCCEFKGGAFLEPKYFGDGLAVALPRNDPQIKVLINDALKKIRHSGRFQELVERYFPVRIY
ncbi:transporter substrate-binding domain-containing protein [Hyphomicrobium sp. LHD-15]|uniref:transporter substrate-binding domain-containing protein n=1 Tax=Hyphomicrobium sp. LHD-15 TaxID=3072142 RepID=UPI00280D220D|nr:transporter substrate-binding domain-containing protein [Hyphomicrobium sp. LHD-15]MDQ8698856.1 transporter substrate-binding domain-containing protein [Hyphomicrobium sp. LHD-15]